MVYKYLYIDDTKDKIEQGTINGLQDGGEISIEFKIPVDWEGQMSDLIKEIPEYDGLILDLKLNDSPYAVGKYAQYRGSSIAQELRTLVKENVDIKKDFPIILISANENMHKSLDVTSLDLFDGCVSKNSIGNTFPFSSFRNKLKWLAEGYRYLNQKGKSINDILDLSNQEILDLRFAERFGAIIHKNVVHVIAKFLVKEVIERPTFLIDERYVAARLGVDMHSEDWGVLRDKYLVDCIYKGAFSNFISRWWMPLIEEFWSKNISAQLSLRNSTSEIKVEKIKEFTGLEKLFSIKKQERSKSSCFWVICKATQVAIDTIDGFVIEGQDDNYPWQESEYISVNEALRPTKDFKVSLVDKVRLQKLKDIIEKNEQRIK